MLIDVGSARTTALPHAVSLLFAALLCGCASRDYPALTAVRDIDVYGGGGISTIGALDEHVEFVVTELAEQDPLATHRVRTAVVPKRVARGLLGSELGTTGRVCNTKEADRVLAELLATHQIDAYDASISLPSDQRGYLALVNQVAFVQSFGLEMSRGCSILDPRIDVANTGMRVDIVADFTDNEGPWAVDVSIDATDLDRPFPEVNVDAPGSGTPVTLQVPVYRNLSLAARATLSAGETLVVAGPSVAGNSDVLIAFLTPTAADMADTAADSHDPTRPTAQGPLDPGVRAGEAEDPATQMTRRR